MKRPDVLYAAFADRVGAEIISASERISETQVRFNVRIPKGPQTAHWLGIIDRLIELGDKQVASGKPLWTIDISKHYFRQPGLRYGWRIILQGANLADYYESLALEAKNVRVQARQIEEVRLVGSPTRRVGGYTDQVPVGALALRGSS